MRSIKLSEYVNVIKPVYVYLRLIPNYSVRNHKTHLIAKTIASLYKNILDRIKVEHNHVRRVLNIETGCKVSYYIYLEKNRVEFYFIVPKQHYSVIREKVSEAWGKITVEEVDGIPKLSDNATKYTLVYTKEDGLSLITDRTNNDLLASNLNVVDVLEKGDKAAILYNFIPLSQFSWRSEYEATIRKIKQGLPVDRNKFGLSYVLKSAFTMIANLSDLIADILGGGDNKKREGDFERLVDRLNGGKEISPSTMKKGSSTVLNTQIVVMSESSDRVRQQNNARSLSQSYDVIAGDNRLVPKLLRNKINLTDYRLKGAELNKMSDEECQHFISLPGRELLERYDFIEKVLTKETQVPDDLRQGVMCIGENIYRGTKQRAYLSTDREYQQLTLVLIGPTRAGKSTLIGNLTYDAIKAGECVVMFDFIKNCELSSEVSALFPRDKVLNIDCSDFRTLQGLGYNEIPHSADPFVRYANAKKQTTQLTTLVNSINTDDTPLSARMNRYLTSAALVVFLAGGSIKDVFAVLQNDRTRANYIEKVPESQRENMQEYIEYLRELDDKNGGTKLHLVEGIISRLNKLKDNPYMELMLKRGTRHNVDLSRELQKNQLINIRMPETMFSTDEERDIYATYWMTKLYLALQVRSERIRDRNKLRKVNLIIDELYQVENTELLLKKRLSRLAKFGLKPIISCHYLNQLRHLREELRSANASYMLISGCDKNNFRELSSELYPFEEEDLLRLPRYHSLNLIKCRDGYARFITKLPPPVVSSTKITYNKGSRTAYPENVALDGISRT